MEALTGHPVGRCLQMGAPKTEVGRAMQERKQRPLLKQTGRQWGRDIPYCNSASILTFDLGSYRHPEDLR